MKVNNQSTFYQYVDRSIQLWLTRGVMRPVLLSARLTASLFIGFLIVGFTVVAILGLSAFSRSLFFGIVDTANLNLAALLPTVLQVFWTSLPYLALTVLLAVISRSPFFAMGRTMVYGTVVERFIPALSGQGQCTLRELVTGLPRAEMATLN